MKIPHPQSPLAARQRCLESLSKSEALRHSVVSHAKLAQQSATSHHATTTANLPALAARVESATDGEEKHQANRDYLQAVSDAAHSEQAFQLARRQQLQSGEDLSPAENATD